MPDKPISAALVYDGGSSIHVPSRLLPAPKLDPGVEWSEHELNAFAEERIRKARQLEGTALEQLCELAGRTCYDSLGAGRPSRSYFYGEMVEGYHDHIRTVGHSSVLAHANVTFTVSNFASTVISEYAVAFAFQKLPGVSVTVDTELRVTANLRTVVDNCFLKSLASVSWAHASIYNYLCAALAKVGHAVAPTIVPLGEEWVPTDVELPFDIKIIDPASEEECWVSMLLTGSRGMTHELVRHNYRCAISQRSTRYVDESTSPWVAHPLLAQLPDEEGPEGPKNLAAHTAGIAQNTYRKQVDTLQEYLISQGVNKFTARKQARGAARGYLGNALYTEVMFSASVAQWKRILRQRATIHADAEIREVAVAALRELQRSRYAHYFAVWSIEPSPDGIGEIAVENLTPKCRSAAPAASPDTTC